MRWVIACACIAFGCRSTHVSELPLVHDISPAASGISVEECGLHLEHTKDYTLWPLMLVADIVIVFSPNGGDTVGLSIEDFHSADVQCRPTYIQTAGPP